MNERLQKVMAAAGVASRRKSEDLIASGYVKVNGQVVTQLGIKVTDDDVIEVNGQILNGRQKFVYYLMYKPRQVICSVKDDKGRKTVLDLMPNDITERIYPVGRLDYDTSGLLLLTNDGKLANQLMHPKYRVNKTYIAKVNGIVSNFELSKLKQGITYQNIKYAPVKSKIISVDHHKDSTIVQLTIHEGKNHEVKNLLEAINHPVKKLRRETYGTLNLQGMTSGDVRELSHNEVRRLKDLIN